MVKTGKLFQSVRILNREKTGADGARNTGSRSRKTQDPCNILEQFHWKTFKVETFFHLNSELKGIL